MGATKMTRKQWYFAHFLAGNLAYMGVSKNLVMQLREYLVRQPGAKPEDYLERLEQLGAAFAGGDDELRQRKELKQIICHVAESTKHIDWSLVLAWTVRLMVVYRPESGERFNPEQEKRIRQRIRQQMQETVEMLERKESYYG